ncbi:hypothetical protein WDV06_19200 [Streptomyces racemochromogenes]|uniref:DoxX family protein n=1 Tax=Streptomyces racemochromogenes TaxID=67353 RepID=A0ABW7PHB2_9ACTN
MTASRPGRGVPAAPRWAVRAARATTLLTLPTGIRRLFLAAGFPAGYTEAGYAAAGIPGWGRVYVVLLGAASELSALPALGLVHPWGTCSRGGCRWWAAAGRRRTGWRPSPARAPWR